MQARLAELVRACAEELAQVKDSAQLNNLKVKYLGKSGELTAISRGMKDVSPAERPLVGKLINDARDRITAAIDACQTKIEAYELDLRLRKERVDITLPGIAQVRGALHPQTIVRQQIVDIFEELGYDIEDGAEVETDYFCFEALNIPKDHPAREMQDTFYITDEYLLRSQTSTTQVHTMQRGVLPIKMLSPGRVYRSDEPDATHSPMFHQIEGLVIDKGITLCDLKGTLDLFARKFFGDGTQTRLRPSFFPFTEPSIEVDATCAACGGKGCRVCKGTGWIEIMGAGMVNPHVLEMSGIDSSVYSGFAFGMGLDRITNIKYGITDLRVVFENDIRFLKQFK